MADKKSNKIKGTAKKTKEINSKPQKPKAQKPQPIKIQTETAKIRAMPAANIYTYETRIPKERIAVLIGKDGEIKKQIEEEAKVKLEIDSTEGDIIIRGKDSILIYTAKEIVRAIGRGFNPEIAMLLLKQDYMFELINLADIAKTKNDAIRLKGRVIGEGGKSRRTIEGLTDCSISVYGKTIGIIGQVTDVAVAKRAIDSLLTGSPHSSVYTFLEKQRKMRRIGEN